MKKIFILYLVLLLLVPNVYCQIDDILKKIPGVGKVFEDAVTTNIKDAYPTAYWLKDVDKKVDPATDIDFSPELSPGYYKFKFNTFCLHAGTYEPTEGAGYLVAPLKGSKAGLIKNILSRYAEHPEIDQKDVQLLIWGIEAKQKFSSYQPDFQFRVQPLLTPDEIALTEVNSDEIASELLPQEVKEALSLYGDIRNKLNDANSTYEDIEKLAVKTGIAPEGKGSKKVEWGTWTSIGNGAYMRCFPHGYQKSDVEIYTPPQVSIQKDNSGNISSLDDGSCRIEFQYEQGASKFKSAVIKDVSSGGETTIDNSFTDDALLKSQTAEFLDLVKKSLGKKKSKRLTVESAKTLSQLKMIELCLNSSNDKSGSAGNGYSLSVNALNGFVSKLESGKKGGSQNSGTGLSNIYGLVFAPGNTIVQRLGVGGPKGGNPKKKNCNPQIVLHRIGKDYVPEPQSIFNVTIDINVEGSCTVEGVKYTLFNVSKEMGRCINDKDPEWYNSRLDFYIDPQFNAGMNVSSDSLSAEGSAQTTYVTIACNDYGAIAKIKAEVKIDGKWYLAKDEGSSANYINLPYDDDNNYIADEWETQNNVQGLPANWDEDPEPTGQAKNGDGLTNYEEYRGCYIYDEFDGVKHIRTDPKKKELFVVDPDNMFVSVTWEKASDIKAYYLTKDLIFGDKCGCSDEMPEYRRVNFCSKIFKGEKFAVNIIKMPGVLDTYTNEIDTLTWGATQPGKPKSPKDAARVKIFPDRMRIKILNIADIIEGVLQLYPQNQNITLAGKSFPRSLLEKFVNTCKDPQKLDLLVDFFVTETTIHEVGHSCGVRHHNPLRSGDVDCPIRYNSDVEIATSDLLSDLFDIVDSGDFVIAIYTKWRFCNTVNNCWGKLNVNDR